VLKFKYTEHEWPAIGSEALVKAVCRTEARDIFLGRLTRSQTIDFHDLAADLKDRVLGKVALADAGEDFRASRRDGFTPSVCRSSLGLRLARAIRSLTTVTENRSNG